jgi:hypothetical protein
MQALEFFVSHRDTIAVLLKDNSEPTSLMALREVHMIVHICSMLLPRVAKNELVSISIAPGNLPIEHPVLVGLFDYWLWSHSCCHTWFSIGGAQGRFVDQRFPPADRIGIRRCSKS